MTEWEQFCSGARHLELAGESVRVDLGGRRHTVEVADSADSIELCAIVARRAVVEAVEASPLAAWVRNRAASLVGFRVDQRGRLVGESSVPKAGLTKDEFLFYVRKLASECDLFEFRLTGRDRE